MLLITTNAHQQIARSIQTPDQRQPGWISYQDLVGVVILDHRDVPRIRIGHVCSLPGSPGDGPEVDNVSKTVIWSDQGFNDPSDSAYDVHEKVFDVKDPCLFRRDEIEFLKDKAKAVAWFRGTHSPRIARKIAYLLSLPDFGKSIESREWASEQRKFSRRFDVNRRHWQFYGRPLPFRFAAA